MLKESAFKQRIALRNAVKNFPVFCQIVERKIKDTPNAFSTNQNARRSSNRSAIGQSRATVEATNERYGKEERKSLPGKKLS
jgi:hypothetical protein